MNTIVDVNKIILDALGIKDAGDITSININLTPTEYPSVEINRFILDGDTIDDILHILDEYELKPKE